MAEIVHNKQHELVLTGTRGEKLTLRHLKALAAAAEAAGIPEHAVLDLGSSGRRRRIRLLRVASYDSTPVDM